jgi:hypothetical protein
VTKENIYSINNTKRERETEREKERRDGVRERVMEREDKER